MVLGCSIVTSSPSGFHLFSCAAAVSFYAFIMFLILHHLLLGLRSPEQQRAWREKMGLLSIILILMAGVGFLTFGFTTAVCGKPPDRFHGGAIDAAHISNNSVVFHGYSYNFTDFKHPPIGAFDGQTNPLNNRDWNLSGNDASFFFQNTNQHCLNIITKSPGSSITGKSNLLDWYFPCNVYSQYGSSGANLTGYESGTNCHTSPKARSLFSQIQPSGQVYYTWDDVKNPSRNLAVYESYVENILQSVFRLNLCHSGRFSISIFSNGLIARKSTIHRFSMS